MKVNVHSLMYYVVRPKWKRRGDKTYVQFHGWYEQRMQQSHAWIHQQSQNQNQDKNWQHSGMHLWCRNSCLHSLRRQHSLSHQRTPVSQHWLQRFGTAHFWEQQMQECPEEQKLGNYFSDWGEPFLWEILCRERRRNWDVLW